jgi:hypothetical protein
MNMKALIPLTLLVLFVGCTKPASDANPSDASTVMGDMPPVLDNHAHPEHGPHGGDLIELGQEAFHAELVHGESGIAIFVLDDSALQSVPIASTSLTASLKHAGEVKAFDFSADPDTNDPSGKSSRFVSADSQLDQWIDAGAEGAIVIEIDGKNYTGKIAHSDEHAGHQH